MNDILRRGLIAGAAQITWLFGGFSILKALSSGIPLASLRAITGLFSLVILFVGVFYGIKKARDHSNEDALTYLEAVKTGVIISIVVALLVSGFSLVYLTIINPGFENDMLNEAGQALRQSGATSEEIATELGRVKSEYSIQSQAIQGLVGQSVMGTIFSLILSILLRTKNKSLNKQRK